MASLFERIAALNTNGPYRAERVTEQTALKGGRHPVLENPRPNAVLGTSLGGAAEFRAAAEGQAEPSGAGAAIAAASAGTAAETEGASSGASANAGATGAFVIDELIVGLGCFWGAERLFWGVPGVLGTSVGYAGGWTKNPTYREVCTGRTGHAEVVRIVFDSSRVSVEELLKVAFENHNPTLGDRQGNDVGSQYRSAVYCSSQGQLERVRQALDTWQQAFTDAGFGDLTTEVGLMASAPSDAGDVRGSVTGDVRGSVTGDVRGSVDTAEADRGVGGTVGCGDSSASGEEVVGDGCYYLAEDEHQQYLHKNPGGYCNHGPNGVTCQTGVL